MIKFLRFIPAQLIFFLIVGVLVGSFFEVQPNMLVVFFLFLILLFLAAYLYSNRQFRSPLIFTAITFLVSFSIGVTSITFKNQLNNKRHYSNSTNFSCDSLVLATVSISKKLKPNAYYNKFEAEVIQIGTSKTFGLLILNVKKDSINNKFKIDDTFLIRALFSEINEPLNPHSFNYKEYLKTQQIHHQISIDSSQFLRIPTNRKTLKGLAASFREKINYSLIKYGFKDDELAVVNALLLGQRQTISKDLLQSYSGAGAIHILAVSGLHIGILLLLLNFLFKPFHSFKNGKLIASISIILLLWIYAVIAGLSPSIVRAVTMFTSIAVGMYLNRASNIYSTLVISMFFLLLFNPYYLFEVGFQLSYLAVFSIVWIQPKLVSLWISKWWLFRKMWQLFTVSIAAQIGVLPLSLYYFHQFPGLFFVTNLVVIPFIGLILVLGILVIIFSFFEIAPHFLTDSYIFIIHQLNSFVKWIAAQEVFIIKNISISLLLLLSVYLLLFFIVKWTEKKYFYRLVLVLIAVVFVQTIVVFEKFQLETTKEFIIFNTSKSTIIGERIGRVFEVFSSEKLNSNIINSYIVGKGLRSEAKLLPPKYYHKFKGEKIIVVDSLGIFNYQKMNSPIVLLEQSPNINLERLILQLQPKIIVANGSNYKSDLILWQETCLKKKTPFYNTLQKGAFILTE